MATLSFLGLFLVFSGQSYALNNNPLPSPTPNFPCDTNYRINGISYTSCFARSVGETDDTGRLQRAIDTVYNAKLVFNEGQADYNISDSLVLHSFMVLEGTSTSILNTAAPNTPRSQIKITTSGKSVFKIGSNVQSVTIRDLGLLAGASGTIGILAEGNNSSGSGHSFEFNHIYLQNFYKGIYVNDNSGSYPSWQFDNVKISNSVIANCNIGIHLRAQNGGWQMDNINFVVPGGGIGVKVENANIVTMNLLVGNGFGGDTFIDISHYTNVTIQNCVAENFTNHVKVDTVGDPNWQLTLINNTFFGPVIIKDATVTSIANFYYPSNVILKGTTQIFSLGDRFCFYAPCTGDFVIPPADQATVKIRFKSNEKDNIFDRPTTMKSDLSLLGGNLNFGSGNTVTLGSSAFSALGTKPNGTQFYCPDCQVANPCASGGTGAFAKRINSVWVCN